MIKKACLVFLGILILGTVLMTGCGARVTKDGDTVKVDYTGKLADGTMFDTSEGREPLQFTLGKGEVVPGFEEAVRGMKVGDSKTVTIPAEKAYGPHHKELVSVIGRNQLPQGMEPKVGQQLQTQQPNGRMLVVVITEVNETTLTVDANHPLAGKDLTFDIKLVEIK